MRGIETLWWIYLRRAGNEHKAALALIAVDQWLEGNGFWDDEKAKMLPLSIVGSIAWMDGKDGTNCMNWANAHIEKLQRGEAVQFRPRGNSMDPIIKSGQLVTVSPVDPGLVEVGDVVLCRVNGKEYLHLVKAIQGERFQIGNNRGFVNGWTRRVFGKVICVED